MIVVQDSIILIDARLTALVKEEGNKIKTNRQKKTIITNISNRQLKQNKQTKTTKD